MSCSDEALVKAWISKRDAEAFAEIVSRYSAMVYSASRRILRNPTDAEDVAQECFVELVRTRIGIRRSLSGWLHTTAVHKSLDRLKTERRRKERESRFAEEVNMRTEPEWSEVQSHIDEAIAALPDKLREPVIQRFLQSQTQDAIAQRLGVSRLTVQRRLDKALEEIRKFLKRRGIPVGAAALAAMLGANMTEAAPATLTAALGKLALAGATGAIGYSGSGTTGSIAALGGVLAMKKVIIGIAVILACIIGLWAVRQKHKPEPVEIARQVDVTQPEKPSPAKGAGALALLKTLSERAVKEERAVSAGKEEESSETETTSRAEGGVISGRVYDADTGEGIAGVVVLAQPASGDGSRGSSDPTDASGQYRIEELTGTKYYLYLSRRSTPEGYAWSKYSEGGDGQTVSLQAGSTTENVDFALQKETPLAGIVVDSGRRAVEDATVALSGYTVNIYLANTKARSAPDGSFSFHNLSPTRDLRIRATKGDALVSPSLGVALPDEGITDLVLVLNPAATVSGTVVDPDGVLLKDIQVIAEESKSVSDSTGHYVLTGLAVGKHKLILREAGDPSSWWSGALGTEIELRAGEQLTNLTLVYDQVHTISGVVVDSAGKPVAGATVSSAGQRSTGRGFKTDERGWYQITGLAEGSYLVLVRADGYQEGERYGVQTDRDDVDFVLNRASSYVIKGQVLSAKSGEPIPRFEVDYVLTPAKRLLPSLFHELQQVSDPDGRFHIEPDRAGNYAVEVRASGYARTYQFVSLDETQPQSEIIFRLESGGDLHGIVRNTAGDPVPHARMFLGGASDLFDTNTTTTAVTAADGTFVIESFPKIAQLVSVYHPDYGVGTLRLPANADLSRPVQIVLTSGGGVKGVVRLPSGLTTLQQRIHIQYPDEHELIRCTIRVNPDGSYEFSGLIPGEANVGMFLIYPDHETETRYVNHPVIIEDGKVTILDIDVPEAHSVLEGSVILSTNEPLSSAVSLSLAITTATGGESVGTRMQDDGTYRMDHVPAGNGILRAGATSQSGKTIEASVPVEIGDGEVVRQDINLAD